MVAFLTELTQAVIALFIIVDPLGNIPIFMGLTENVPRNPTQKSLQHRNSGQFRFAVGFCVYRKHYSLDFWNDP